MPSTTPLSRTQSTTSSVMSRTWSPPLVRSCVSCWKTFTVRSPSSVVGGRRSAGSAYFEGRRSVWKGEPTERAILVAGTAAAGGRVVGLRRLGVHVLSGRAAAGTCRPDRDRAFHAHVLVAVDRAVDLVRPGLGERHLECPARAGRDVRALLLDAVALDLQGVVDRAVVDALEDVGAGLRERDRARVELVLGLIHGDRLDHRAAARAGGVGGRGGRFGFGARAAGAATAARGDRQHDDHGAER